jgi:SAM-dependent methyltransferase
MIKLDLHYVDPRLVDLYDIENPRGADTDFYVQLAAELDARHILDLGCGTGLFTRELAVDSRKVVGVDPAAAMLAVARRQPGADRVQWVEGSSKALGTPGADLLIMTSHVAQVFLDDVEWADTLQDIHNALRPGGHLAFESRNPDYKGWERWNREISFARYPSPHGIMETWVEVVSEGDGRIHFEGHNVFTATGEVVVVSSELRFRSQAEITASLINAGFAIEQLYGDWDRGPFLSASPEMIFIAQRS